MGPPLASAMAPPGQASTTMSLSCLAGALDREEAQDANASVLEMFFLGSKGKERIISSFSSESSGTCSKVKRLALCWRWARWGTHSVPKMQLINGHSNGEGTFLLNTEAELETCLWSQSLTRKGRGWGRLLSQQFT